MDIQHVGVIGCGLMGSGIAQVSAQAGLQVTVLESEGPFLDSGLKRIQRSWDKLVEKSKLEASDREASESRLRGTLEFDDLKSADLVVEAVTEDLGMKQGLFERLGQLCPQKTILASNTSSFPIIEMAKASGRADRVVGLHFFNPPALMKLVEVIRTDETSDDVFQAADQYAKRIGKVAVHAKDTPGFVVNRLLVPYLLEAVRMLERGEATRDDIDQGMMLGCGHPMGPLTLLDYVGLDTTLAIIEGWHERFPDNPLFFPPQQLKDMVNDGRLGRKSGEGFYKWDGDKRA